VPHNLHRFTSIMATVTIPYRGSGFGPAGVSALRRGHPLPGVLLDAPGGLPGTADGVFLKVHGLGFRRFPWLRPVDAVDPRLPVACVVCGPPRFSGRQYSIEYGNGAPK
jgi:hypothetical protein